MNEIQQAFDGLVNSTLDQVCELLTRLIAQELSQPGYIVDAKASTCGGEVIYLAIGPQEQVPSGEAMCSLGEMVNTDHILGMDDDFVLTCGENLGTVRQYFWDWDWDYQNASGNGVYVLSLYGDDRLELLNAAQDFVTEFLQLISHS